MDDIDGSVTIFGDHSCFKLYGAYDPAPVLGTWTSTLVRWLDHTAGAEADLIVQTGSQFGPYAVDLQVLGAMPDDPAATWEDVAEISLMLGSTIGVGELIDGPDDWHDVEAGAYRLRVSARGRTESSARERTFPDDDLDDDEDEPLEHYRLELWPEAARPPTTVRESSRFAHETLEPPAPQWPVEREPGLVAARAVTADLRNGPGARTLTGQVGEVRVSVEVADTPTRMFNRVKFTNGWPPSNGGSLGFMEEVGETASHYADPPDDDGTGRLLGMIDTQVVELVKPKRLVMRWNWRVAGEDGRPYPTNPRLLATDSTVTITVVAINGEGQDPRTVVAVHHAGVPVEWLADLEALWLWDLADAVRR